MDYYLISKQELDAIYDASVKLRNNRTLTIGDLRVLADTLEEIVWNAHFKADDEPALDEGERL